MKRYEFRYIITFQDTNLVGNVYFSNFISWQGKCRELFLKEEAPEILEKIEKKEFSLITLNCSCNFLAELKVFDEVVIYMSLEELHFNRIIMRFDYHKIQNGNNKKVATGNHEIGFYIRDDNKLDPISVPETLIKSLQKYKADF